MSNEIDDKAGIVEIAQDLAGTDENSNYVSDEDRLGEYFDEVMNEMCMSLLSPFMGAAIVRTESGTAEYDWPTDCQRLVALFQDDVQMSKTSVKELEAYAQDWRSDSGTPWAWMLDRETARKLLVYPKPDATGDAVSTPYQWGSSWPEDDLSIVFSEYRDKDIPDWAVLYFSFSMLAREYRRVSDHQDLGFADLCDSLAIMTGSMVGIVAAPAAEES